MDDYCIALLVLVLFFIYIDNQNKTEGYDEYGASLQEVEKGGGLLHRGEHTDEPTDEHHPIEEVDSTEVKQDYVPIGLEPKPVKMEAPSSMDSSLQMLSAAPANMESYMLLADSGSVHDVVVADLPMAYPRVGAADNLGQDTLHPQGMVLGQADHGGEHAGIGTLDGSDMHGSAGSASAGSAGSEKVVGAGEFKAVIIYAPWCGWSKKSLPDFEKMDGKLNSLSPSETNGWNVSCEVYDSETPEGKAKAKEYEVEGFPTVITEVNGQRGDGPREYDKMVSLVNETTGGKITP
jgi:thiol-disulfide isomerase/thioredoxin